MSAQPQNNLNNVENPGLIAGHALYVKGAAEVDLAQPTHPPPCLRLFTHTLKQG